MVLSLKNEREIHVFLYHPLLRISTLERKLFVNGCRSSKAKNGRIFDRQLRPRLLQGKLNA
jgi:hypothetical protein